MAVLSTYVNDDVQHGTTIFILTSAKQRKWWKARVKNLKIGHHQLLDVSGSWEQKTDKYWEWLEKALRFVNHFGKVLVPKDLREYINIVEMEVVTPATDFPEQCGAAAGEGRPVAGQPDGVAEVVAAGILNAQPLDWRAHLLP